MKGLNISESSGCLNIEIDNIHNYVLTSKTGIVLREGFQQWVEQRLVTEGEGKHKTQKIVNTKITDFCVKTIEGEEVNARLLDDIPIKQEDIVTIINAKKQGTSKEGLVSLIYHDTDKYYNPLHFAKSHILKHFPNDAVIYMGVCLIPLYFSLYLGKKFELGDLPLYVIAAYAIAAGISCLYTYFKREKRNVIITESLGHFANSFFSKINKNHISSLKNYYKDRHQMNNNINIERSNVQFGNNNSQTNFMSAEINLSPSKAQVGEALDAIERNQVTDSSFTEEIKNQVMKEAKSYVLGEVKALTKSTAEWIMKLAGMI